MNDPQNNLSDWNTDAAIRDRILNRAKTLTIEIIDRLTVAVDDLSHGNYLGALGALDGIEQNLTTVRSILLLLS